MSLRNKGTVQYPISKSVKMTKGIIDIVSHVDNKHMFEPVMLQSLLYTV